MQFSAITAFTSSFLSEQVTTQQMLTLQQLVKQFQSIPDSDVTVTLMATPMTIIHYRDGPGLSALADGETFFHAVKLLKMTQRLSDLVASLESLEKVNPKAVIYLGDKPVSMIQTTTRVTIDTDMQHSTYVCPEKDKLRQVLDTANQKGSTMLNDELFSLLQPLQNMGLITFSLVGNKWYCTVINSLLNDYEYDVADVNILFHVENRGNWRIYRSKIPGSLFDEKYGIKGKLDAQKIVNECSTKIAIDGSYTVTEKNDHESRIETRNAAGKLHGLCEVRYSDGSLWETSYYDNDQFHGDYTVYHQNGQKYRVTTYLKGVAHGPYIRWDETGKVVEEALYENGKFTTSKEVIVKEGLYVRVKQIDYITVDRKMVLHTIGQSKIFIGIVSKTEDATDNTKILPATAEETDEARKLGYRVIQN